MATQLITPNPNIWCRPGYCLEYVRKTFGLPIRYGNATEAWDNSPSQHRDRNFPTGLAVAVWYGLDTTELGHVVLRMPDGSVFSTSDLRNVPHHHPDLADLEAYYAYYKMNLTYRGWTEDVCGFPVISLDGGIAAQGTIIKAQEEDELADAVDRIYGFTTTLFRQYHEASIAKIYSFTTTLFKQYHEASINETRAALRDAFKAYAESKPEDGSTLDPKDFALQVAKNFDDILSAGVSAVANIPETIEVEPLEVEGALLPNQK
jgi:hypothetical protein